MGCTGGGRLLTGGSVSFHLLGATGVSEALVEGEVLFEGGPAPPSPGVRRGPHRRVTEWLGRGYGARTTQEVWSPSLPVCHAISQRCWPQFSFLGAAAAEALAFPSVMGY